MKKCYLFLISLFLVFSCVDDESTDFENTTELLSKNLKSDTYTFYYNGIIFL